MILLLATAAFAQESPQSMGYHLAQARQFVKNKWYDDAANEIELALATQDGAADFEVNWLGAQIYQELVKMHRAAELARRAADLAPNENARGRCAEVADYLEQSWGEVTITAPYKDMRSRLQVEATSPIIDPEEKRLLNKVALRLRENTPLPTTVSLPVAGYLVNGVPVTVVGGGEKTVALQMDQLGAKGLAALQVSRLEVSVGTLARFSDRVGGIAIGPTVELAFTQPLGPVVVGLVGAWDPRSYESIAQSAEFDPLGWSAGLRVGRELSVGGPVALRPSLGARWVALPGVPMDCKLTDTSAATCVDPGKTPPDLVAYADAHGVAPFFEFAAEYRQGGRTTALGVGVKVTAEDLLGWLPKEGDIALVDGSGPPIRYSSSTSLLNVPGIRLSGTLDFAF